MSFWWAFRCDDAARVVEKLELRDTRPCSFAEGAQAFLSDDKRRAWLRASDGELGRCMVFDGEGYPFTRGTREPDEPQFPQLPATPADADVRKMARKWSLDPSGLDKSGVVGTRHTAVRLPRYQNEDGETLFIRVGDTYLQNKWNDDFYTGDILSADVGPFNLSWPSAWGAFTPWAHGVRSWTLPDADVAVQVDDGWTAVPPSIQHWMAIRRQLLGGLNQGWKTVGGQRLHHDHGQAFELGACPDEIPHARGRELATLFHSARLRK